MKIWDPEVSYDTLYLYSPFSANRHQVGCIMQESGAACARDASLKERQPIVLNPEEGFTFRFSAEAKWH